jgi:hypothetical protein
VAQQYNGLLALTSDLTTVSFGFRPNFIKVDASTANTAYLSFGSTVATTGSTTNDSYQLTSGGASLLFSNPAAGGLTSRFFAIASTSSTATIRVLAVRI